MNIIELNSRALFAACAALLGAEKTQVLSETYILLDTAEKQGFADGYNSGEMRGFKNGFEAGETNVSEEDYKDGFSDGYNAGMVNTTPAYNEGYEHGYSAGNDDGYEQARRDLGEQPIIDADFDDEGTAFLQNKYLGVND